jgi:hypothetical protein
MSTYAPAYKETGPSNRLFKSNKSRIDEAYDPKAVVSASG